ncbi:2,3-diaminopropionate biosynthesis protein SbnB [Burkholderia singularis]|uniref:2,3-diaminopropionate biosynthesis protein SbnB n=1 Tax=Burkholderia singularis TaxID=1503053 RepID=A0A103E5C8_9BURK|nr:2,3-diaminopropionate biosynthesis protein SbnB [Burkholderia singularis]KVE28648.1 2,3-diaminopropionate biosynthesis protein SbnB [Burkholderia singularis]
MTHDSLPFHVVTGVSVRRILDRTLRRAITSVEQAYLAHHDGQTINPDSYFLRFPQRPSDRIIALPAAVDGSINVTGIKWIASYPSNLGKGLARASATLVLNDPATGYPFAFLEASQISAVRTAASAVLAANWCTGHARRAASVAFIGAGVIAKNIFDMFVADEWTFDEVVVHDRDLQSSESLSAHAARRIAAKVRVDTLSAALDADLVVFATNAGTPYVDTPTRLRAGQTILNISLRDLAPSLLMEANNVVDDVDHCLKADTSPHLAGKMSGGRAFINGTIAQLIRGEIALDPARATVFSPFGLGVLDLAIGKQVYDIAVADNLALSVPGFFPEVARW